MVFRSVKNFISIVMLCISSFAFAAENANVSKYVDDMMGKFFDIAKDTKLQKNERIARAESIISDNMDFSWMASFVLGRYRRNISAEELSNFSSIYKNYLVATYAAAVEAYKGQGIKVRSVHPLSDKEFAVKVDLIGEGTQSLSIDYLIRQYDSSGKTSYKVFDVVTEGVSLISSEQAEFSGIVANNSLSELEKILAAKTTEQKASVSSK